MKASAQPSPPPPLPWHTPPVQVSAVVQTLPSSQAVPSGARRSGGHVVELPSHSSATSHAPETPRHSVPAVATSSVGHAALEPVHSSATSQSPATPRHSVPLARKPSAAHAPLPSQFSATSQSPFTGRHGVPAVAWFAWQL